MPSDHVTTRVEGVLAVVTIDNPTDHNRLDETTRLGIVDAVAAANEDDSVRVVMLTGNGGAFATGLETSQNALQATSAAATVAATSKPTIAWVDGDCMDMGLELALACDIRVCSARSRFAMRHVANGMLPWDGGTQRLARLVGRGHALRLLLTGEAIDANEAMRTSLVQQVCTAEDAAALAKQIAAGAPIAARYAKEAALAAGDVTLDQGLRLEADLSVLLHSTNDRAEGLRSFRDKDEPEYHGR